jgi:hypothetical protein
VTDLAGPSSLAAVKTSPKNCLLVPGTTRVAGYQADFPCTTHTHTGFLLFTGSTYKARSKASTQRQSKNNAMRDESTRIALLVSTFCSLHAAVSEDATPVAISLRRRPARRHLVSTRCAVRTQTRKYGLVGFDRSSQRPHRSPVLTLVSGVPQRSCTSGKKHTFHPFKWADMWCLYLQTQRAGWFSIFLRGQDRQTGRPGRFDPATYL